MSKNRAGRGRKSNQTSVKSLKSNAKKKYSPPSLSLSFSSSAMKEE
jgi:hypothetical protein